MVQTAKVLTHLYSHGESLESETLRTRSAEERGDLPQGGGDKPLATEELRSWVGLDIFGQQLLHVEIELDYS